MQKTWRSHLLVSYALAVLAFLYLPILILALYSFNDSRMNAVWAGFTFKWYSQLFNNRHVAEALANTLIIGFISTAVSTILGTTAALALHKYRYKYRGILNGFIYLPILIPEIVMGLSLLVLFSQIHLSLGRTSIILAHITFCLSFVVITVRPALRYGLVKSTFSARSGVIVSAETAASMLPLTSAGTRPSSVMEIICTSNPFRRPISRIRSMSKPSYLPFCEFTYSNGA